VLMCCSTLDCHVRLWIPNRQYEVQHEREDDPYQASHHEAEGNHQVPHEDGWWWVGAYVYTFGTIILGVCGLVGAVQGVRPGVTVLCVPNIYPPICCPVRVAVLLVFGSEQIVAIVGWLRHQFLLPPFVFTTY